MNNFLNNPDLPAFLFGPFGWFLYAFPLLLIWSLFWKGLGLWHSARRGQPWWFVILLLVNTLGLLEIIYLFAIAKVKTDKLFKK